MKDPLSTQTRHILRSDLSKAAEPASRVVSVVGGPVCGAWTSGEVLRRDVDHAVEMSRADAFHSDRDRCYAEERAA